MTMINLTKKQKDLYEMYKKEIAPSWMTFDENLNHVLRKDAPEDIKKKYELFMKS